MELLYKFDKGRVLMAPKALITGISGQDGSYLAELLIEKGYEVYGISKNINSGHLDFVKSKIKIYECDIKDSKLLGLIKKIQPDELYHLASESHITYENIPNTIETIANASVNVMETLKTHLPDCKMFQAGSSQMFGDSVDLDGYQRETTKMSPSNPYGCAKLLAYNISKIYRNTFNLQIVNGFLFNHESIRRSEQFVTTKIVKQAVKIKKGYAKELFLKNTYSLRDWSHAKDFVKGMWLAMQNPADDYIFASGKLNSVSYVCDYVFDKLNLDVSSIVVEDEYNLKQIKSVGDPSKLKNKTGWYSDYTLESMLDEMIDYYYIHTV